MRYQEKRDSIIINESFKDKLKKLLSHEYSDIYLSEITINKIKLDTNNKLYLDSYNRIFKFLKQMEIINAKRYKRGTLKKRD